MNTSIYQLAKIHIISFIDLSKDAVHIYIGLFVLFFWVLISRKPLRSFKALIPVLLAAVFMEALDLRDGLRSLGHFRWRAGLHDILNTMFWPVFIVLLFKLRLIKSK